MERTEEYLADVSSLTSMRGTVGKLASTNDQSGLKTDKGALNVENAMRTRKPGILR